MNPPLERVIWKCLAKDPDERFQAARDLKTAMAWAMEQQPYPPTGAKWQVSKQGGAFPKWRGDGKELFFVNQSKGLMSAEVRAEATPAGSTFDVGVPKPLFPMESARDAQRFSETGDGQRFLV